MYILKLLIAVHLNWGGMTKKEIHLFIFPYGGKLA